MTSTVHTNIGQLLTLDARGDDTGVADGVAGLGIIEDAALVVEDDRVAWLGPATEAPAADTASDHGGQVVIPAFVDSHAHLVFAGDRSAEFTARMAGEAYDGGGIAVTRAATMAASDDDLRALIAARVEEMRAQGTGVVEIKSGYGLTSDEELRHLRLAREFTDEVTHLGAHVVPPELRDDRGGYVQQVIDSLPAAAEYARWADVFCEPHSPHAFTGDESREILTAARAAGLELRVHGNQLGPGPGAGLAVEFDAASVDHCTFLTDGDIAALAGSNTTATLLPGVEFSTRQPYPDAHRLLDAGVSLALATDCNPGTCYSSSMPFMIQLAVREMGFHPAQALLAATIGGARALRRPELGRLRVGGPALLTRIDAPSWEHLAYRPGVPLASLVGSHTVR